MKNEIKKIYYDISDLYIHSNKGFSILDTNSYFSSFIFYHKGTNKVLAVSISTEPYMVSLYTGELNLKGDLSWIHYKDFNLRNL